MKHLAFLAIAILWVTPALAQLVEPNQVGVRMGHVHLAVTGRGRAQAVLDFR